MVSGLRTKLFEICTYFVDFPEEHPVRRFFPPEVKEKFYGGEARDSNIYIYKYKIAGCFKLPVRRRRELIEKQQDHDLSETSPRWSIRSIRFVEKNRFLRKAYMAAKAKAWKGV